jgi:hypothetical protein
VEEVARLARQLEEAGRARVGLEMRCLELEELRDRWALSFEDKNHHKILKISVFALCSVPFRISNGKVKFKGILFITGSETSSMQCYPSNPPPLPSNGGWGVGSCQREVRKT